MIEIPAMLNRRSFLQSGSAFLALPLFGLGALLLSSCARNDETSFARSGPDSQNGAAPNWKTVIVSDQEPGAPLIVSGTIYAPDRRTPLEGINLWIYQTDAT